MVHMCRRSSVTRSTTLTAPGTPTAEHATLPPLGYKSSPNRSKGGYEMSAQRRGGVGGNGAQLRAAAVNLVCRAEADARVKMSSILMSL